MATQTEAIRIAGPHTDAQPSILTPQAAEFLLALHTRFELTRQALLEERKRRQARFDAGQLPHFLDASLATREASWKVAPIPADLLDRRVEITGPTDRKMIINALNSGASVFMADFEDSNSPTWQNCIDGQLNLYDAVRRAIEFKSPEGKEYRLNPKIAVLFVRPRGWHLSEKHFLVNGTPISASLFDFGLFFFHNAKEQIARGTGPYFYLPKMESHQEAKLWNDVFVFAQEYIGIPKGTIRATVLIETITAAFEMDEILYELRDHSAGLNCGRWITSSASSKSFGTAQVTFSPTVARSPCSSRSCALTSSCSFIPAIVAAFTPWAEWRRRFPSAIIPKPMKKPWSVSVRTSCAK